MKTKLTVTVRTDKKDDGLLTVSYGRKDLEKPKNKDEELILTYIQGVIRACIDNGFAPTKKEEKEEKDGDTVQE